MPLTALFVPSRTSWWTLGLFPGFCCCKHCQGELPCTHVPEGTCPQCTGNACIFVILPEVATLLTGWNELVTEVSPCEPVNLKVGV